MLNILLRIAMISLFTIRWWYWRNAERNADVQKPKAVKISAYHLVSKMIWFVLYTIVLLQLCGLQIAPIMEDTRIFQEIGLLFGVIGLAICLAARRELGLNWANGYEYQIKARQELVTSGIYAYIRHPIYLGLLVMLIGGELVAGSWLFISYCFFFIGFYVQGKREEKILLAHFGEAYKDYMQHTKMLIPFVL